MRSTVQWRSLRQEEPGDLPGRLKPVCIIHLIEHRDQPGRSRATPATPLGMPSTVAITPGVTGSPSTTPVRPATACERGNCPGGFPGHPFPSLLGPAGTRRGSPVHEGWSLQRPPGRTVSLHHRGYTELARLPTPGGL